MDTNSEDEEVYVPGYKKALDRKFKVQKDLNIYTRDIYDQVDRKML